MRLVFSRSWLPGSFLIRLLTFSKWSHVALVIDDHTVVEAVYPKVRITTLSKFLSEHPDHEFRQLDGATDVVIHEVGKPYDVGGLFMLLNPWRDDWKTDDKWFCSELIASATNLFSNASRVTPQMLYLVSRGYDKTAKSGSGRS